MSGFWRVMPPEARQVPGVNGVPLAWKKSLRGPSEENVSTWFAALKGFGNAADAGTAATPNAFKAVLWPVVCPGVFTVRRPRFVVSRR